MRWIMTASFANADRRRVSLWAIAVLTIVGIVGANVLRGSDTEPAVRTFADCVSLDREASEALAPLLHDHSVAAEWKLDQALLQLRRARKHCRSGSVELAGHDYNSIVQAFPVLTGSVGSELNSNSMDLSARRRPSK